MDNAIWQKRSRILTQALIVSGALNIALFATFCFFVFDKKMEMARENLSSKPKDFVTNAEVISCFCEKNFSELVELLHNKESIEDGYCTRDLALSILVSFHQFYLEKALGRSVSEERKLLFSKTEKGEKIELSIFPNLKDEEYQAVIRYAQTEKWPLTNQGLFFAAKRLYSKKMALDSTLMTALCQTKELIASAILLGRCGYFVTKGDLLELILEGDFCSLEKFYLEQQRGAELSKERGRDFLLEYLAGHSPKAAHILLKWDFEFVTRRLTDELVLFVLDSVSVEDQQGIRLAKALLCSTRGERVFRVAAERLYASVNEPLPADFHLLKAIERFCKEALRQVPSPEKTPTFPVARGMVLKVDEKKHKKRTYIVQERDSLWKIAKKQGTTVEAISKLNHLETEKLRPGQVLELPPK